MTDLVPTTVDLTLHVSGPTAIETVRDLQLTMKLTNTSRDKIILVSEPSGVLSYGLPTEQYIVYTSESRARPTFTGVIVDFSLEGAIEDGCVVTLAPEQFITVNHDLSGSYDFTATGEGQYTFVPKNHFYVVDPITSQYTLVEATHNLVHQHSISIKGILAIDHDQADTKSETSTSDSDDDRFVGLDKDQRTGILEAMELANDYIKNSAEYLTDVSSDTDRYKTWLGSYDEDRHVKIVSIFEKIEDQIFEQSFNGIGANCKCGCDQTKGTCTHTGDSCPKKDNPCHCKNIIAYVSPKRFGTIYIMQAFWRIPMNGIKCKPGTLVHELTHFEDLGGTSDHKYGQDACKELAKDHPDTAVDNADSLRFFAENVPELE